MAIELGRTTGRALIEALPVFGSFAKALSRLEQNLRRRRIAEWAAALLLTDDSPEEFAKRIRRDMKDPKEGGFAREAINESVRATVDALDDIVIPSLALLTSTYLRRRAAGEPWPDRRAYRDILEMLRYLDADEYRALRDVVHLLAWRRHEPVFTNLLFDSGADIVARAIAKDVVGPEATNVWVWYTTQNRSPDEKTVLLLGDIAFRVVAALDPITRTQNEPHLETPSFPRKPILSRPMLQLLAEILPAEPL